MLLGTARERALVPPGLGGPGPLGERWQHLRGMQAWERALEPPRGFCTCRAGRAELVLSAPAALQAGVGVGDVPGSPGPVAQESLPLLGS